MSDSNMPAAEAMVDGERELASYELAFHVLPTVAEGEVTTVFETIKNHLTKLGGTITIEEAPARFDLAYEVDKYLEGRNRKFTSAYFGWVRFTIEPVKLAEIAETVEGTKEILRHLLIRLTKVEEAHPFYFHEAIASKKVETIDTDEVETEVDEEVVVEAVAEVKGGSDAEETV
jgi:ribosomal protein S6